MKKLFSKAPFTKDAIARREIVLAHTVIVLLSLSLAAVLMNANSIVTMANAKLIGIAVVLLCITALISISVIAVMVSKKK